MEDYSNQFGVKSETNPKGPPAARCIVVKNEKPSFVNPVNLVKRAQTTDNLTQNKINPDSEAMISGHELEDPAVQAMDQISRDGGGVQHALNVQTNEPGQLGQQRSSAALLTVFMLMIKLLSSNGSAPRSDIEAGPARAHPNGATNEKILTQTTDEKWKYITSGLTLFGLSFPFFGLYFNTHWHNLADFLVVMICCFMFSSIFLGLSYMVYHKISEEERLKSLEGVPNNYQIAGCSVQLCLFFSFVFLAVTVYVIVAANAASEYIDGQYKTP